MKKKIKKLFPLPFEVGKTYTAKFASGDRFLINEIRANKEGIVIGFKGIYEKCPDLGVCPLNADRLYPDTEQKEVEITVCDNCEEGCQNDKCKNNIS